MADNKKNVHEFVKKYQEKKVNRKKFEKHL